MNAEDNVEKQKAADRGRQRGRRRRRVLIGAAATLAALVVILSLPTDYEVSGSGHVMAADDAVLRAGVKGAIRQVLVRTGDLVEKGQVLIQLEDSQQQADLLRTQRRLEEAKAALKRLKAEVQLQQAQQKVEIRLAELALADAKREMEQLRQLYENKNATAQEYEKAKLAYQSARARLEQVSIPRDALQAARIEVQQRQIAILEADLLLCRRQLELRKITSPIAGRIVLHERSVGQVVDANQVLGQVFDESSYVMVARMPESYISVLRPGQPVTVETSAYPSRHFGYLTGQVTALGGIVNPQASGDGTILLRARLHQAGRKDMILTPGMTGRIWVNAGRTRLIWRLLGRRVFKPVEAPEGRSPAEVTETADVEPIQ